MTDWENYRRYQRKYYEDHKADLNRIRVERDRKDPVAARVRKERYRAKNRKAIREKDRLYHLENPEMKSRYRINNPVWQGKARCWEHARRARARNAKGSFTVAEWNEVLERHEHKCAHCGATGKLEQDHIQPLFLGGDNYITNIQPLCKSCNCRKRARYVG